MSESISLKRYSIEDIRALAPCYDPSKHLPEDWEGTLLDGLRMEAIPAADRIWVACRLLDDRTARLFAVWCARETLKLVKNPDPRSIAACDVAERYANGLATDGELAATRAAIEATYWDPAGAATGAATRAATWFATWDPAWNTARAATWDAAWTASWATYWDPAGAATWDAQVAQLIKMIEEQV